MQTLTKKKVLFLITKSNWGGAQRYVYDLATNLDQTKFEPIVALGGDGPLSTMLENANIRVIRLQEMQNTTSGKQVFLAVRELWKVIGTESPDVLHVNSSIAGFVGVITGRFRRVPKIIFTAHGWAFNEDRSYWQKLVIKFVHYLTVMLSHKTIAVSRALVTQMNWPGAEKKMKIINPGRTIGPMYDRAEARIKIIDFCPALTAFAGDNWLVSIAELHPIKRHTILISALAEVIKKHPHTRLVLIGDGKERSVIESQVSNLGLSKHVFMLGNIVEAARFLKAFDLFVLASKSESYGYVLHEAGLVNVPIIATNVGGIPDIVGSRSEGVLIKPDSISELLAAILEVLEHPKEAQERAEKLAEKLKRRTVAVMAQETSYLYAL